MDSHKTVNPTDITIGRILTSVYKLSGGEQYFMLFADGKYTGDSRKGCGFPVKAS